MKVGQEVYVVKPKYRSTDQDELYKIAVVKSVGRKFFQLEDYRYKFSLEDMYEEVDSNYRSKVYLSIKEIEDEKEFADLSRKIRNAFQGYSKLPYTLETLRAINELLTQVKL